MKVEFVVSHGVAFREGLLGINAPLCSPRPCIALGACGTEAGDQRGGEWEPIKISSKFESSAYIPKSPNPSSVLTKVWSSY